MNQISLSNSPFLNRPIKVNSYGVSNETIEVEQEIEQPIKKPIEKQKIKKKIISAKKTSLPEVENEPIETDPSVESFQFDNENENENVEEHENSENLVDEEKMSSTQSKETANAIIMVVNQIMTVIGHNVCLIDENSILTAVQNGELPDEIHEWAEKVNENTKKQIPLSNEQQQELVRALAIILKESNFSSVSPTHMAILSIAMVFIGQIKKLIDLNKSNQKLLEEAFLKINDRESNIPQVKVQKEVITETPIQTNDTQKVSVNEKQEVV